MEEIDALEWIDDVLEDAASTDPVELEALAREGLKLSRKAKIYRDEVIFAFLVDFYHWTPRQGRVKASARVAQNLGRGPAFARKLSKQARFFEKNGAIEPSRQGKKETKGGMMEDERVEMGVQRMLRTVETGKITPKLLLRHVNDHLLPSLNLKKKSISLSTARSWLICLGYRRKKHSKGIYYDGHERKDVRKRRMVYLKEHVDVERFVARYEGPAMDESVPSLEEGEKEHVWIYQDESGFHDNDAQGVSYWLKPGEQVLKKKGRGRLMMVSGFICERFGNLELTDEMKEANAKLPESIRLPITDSRVVIYPTSKEGGDDYWNAKQMLKTSIPIARQLFPNAVIHWVFDNSSCHDCMPADALSTSKVLVNPAGGQPFLRDTIIPLDNPFGHGGKPQQLVFPTHLPDDHPYKKFEGKQKGMKVILEERGYIGPGQIGPGGKKIIGDCAVCKGRKKRKPQVVGDPPPEPDPEDSEDSEDEEDEDEPTECCMRRILSLQEDFRSQKSLLEIIIEEAGDMFCHFLPKFHPEMNPIEYFWGWVKRYYRERSNGNFQAGKLLLHQALAACPRITIRRFFRRAQRYMSVYGLGATGLAAEYLQYAVKKYRSHRGVSQQDLDTANEERSARDAKLHSR
ncbi:uncharacterized protein STEHIDRAFT_67794 [Stereum hirsutum FP-91666 SS1]|uniref:uncharacterized protein n=1 Tax=Stereum hirsutum (strain FP-91666) TaxID=721885 RepID=UPI0004449C81|nr:uncharacterized protein STEHIDRAFT_67794 [Stereum hirsutum FP-91666 SS1]EIM80914.1 hypothetical protein STEHIDRAFT_67794 [Stereum hirsutum FP-91666 SS1]